MEKLEYITKMAIELAKMADDANDDTLSILLRTAALVGKESIKKSKDESNVDKDIALMA